MINSSDILQLCRLCLVEDKVNHPIFEESDDLRSISLKISSCLPVSIHKDDSLPKKICDTCSTKLDSFYQFWSESANAEKQLLQWVDKNKTSKQQADQSRKMETTEVKKELEDTVDPIDMTSEAQTYILQQQQLPYTSSAPNDSLNTSESEEPAAKRPRRASAVKALQHMGSEDEDDAELAADNYAKTESDDSDKEEEDEDSNYQENPSTTSVEDQPGPSGMSKKKMVLDDTPYGISKETANTLFDLVYQDLCKAATPNIPPYVEFMVTLWKIFSPDPQSYICNFYGITEKDSLKSFTKVIPALYSHAKKFIQWPTGDYARAVKANFARLCGCTQVLGAIGYTSLHVQFPHSKKCGLLEVQLVCDHRGVITHWECGYLNLPDDDFPPLRTIVDDDTLCPDPSSLIGTSYVGTKDRVQTPFPDSGMFTMQHVAFNEIAKKALKQVKKCIALLKGRMRSLLHVISIDNKQMLKQFVGVCVMIHNICVLNKDDPGLKPKPDFLFKYGRYCSYTALQYTTTRDTSYRTPNEVMDRILHARYAA
ncbi:uncharacterized protein LOC123322962 isoform X9 [Coccinella septempunctata]|uniref:uncharacterized protein LOC123322962 isoform X9 n=1 Tax=Coccinella septempunctata TaxID=41139 RepID=UPI001D06776F|nr:uncharacterized protein LOC123322962 isoform X9 [Coccinella septempunctata]